MGFEEVLIRFFDRISRAKKVKSRLMDQSNFSESTRVSQPIEGNKPVGRLPFLLSLLRKTNDAKGLFTCEYRLLCSRQFDSRSKRNCVISVIQLKTYLIMFRQILKEVFAPVGIIMITCDDRVFLQCRTASTRQRSASRRSARASAVRMWPGAASCMML